VYTPCGGKRKHLVEKLFNLSSRHDEISTMT